MKLLSLLSFSVLLLSVSYCSEPKKNKKSLKQEVDNYLLQAMELYNIPGLALAVQRNGDVIYKDYFGKASLDSEQPVGENTIFRMYSATKLITAMGIFQLIEKGSLTLDDPISMYLDDLPIHWQQIKIKNLLTHSSGLPDIIRYESSLSDKELLQNLYSEKMQFQTGSTFRYNQTNYWFLGKIIEKVTGSSFEEYITANQFDNAPKGILFSSNSREVIDGRAIRYVYNGNTQKFEATTNDDGNRAHSGNGLNISIDQLLKWDRKINNNELLEENTKRLMWTPYEYEQPTQKFLHGWGVYTINNIDSYGFSGGNVSAFRKFVSEGTTIVLLSNGYQIPAFDIIINDIARIVIPEINLNKVTLEQDVLANVLTGDYSEGISKYERLKTENPKYDFSNLKWNINSIGNTYMYSDDLVNALDIFHFNAEVNPEWWVSAAGLAEAYEMRKDTIKAIKYYEKAIVLNHRNEMDYNGFMKNKTQMLNIN